MKTLTARSRKKKNTSISRHFSNWKLREFRLNEIDGTLHVYSQTRTHPVVIHLKETSISKHHYIRTPGRPPSSLSAVQPSPAAAGSYLAALPALPTFGFSSNSQQTQPQQTVEAPAAQTRQLPVSPPADNEQTSEQHFLSIVENDLEYIVEFESSQALTYWWRLWSAAAQRQNQFSNDEESDVVVAAFGHFFRERVQLAQVRFAFYYVHHCRRL
jgi:hypothetical protein